MLFSFQPPKVEGATTGRVRRVLLYYFNIYFIGNVHP